MNKQEIKKYILDQGSDSIEIFGGTYTGGIYLQQHPDEISEIFEFLLKQKKLTSMLEVGSAAGANAKVFYEILNLDELFIVDNNQHDNHIFRKQNLMNTNYEEYIGDSQSEDAHNYILNSKKKFDIIYIDADHSYEGVKRDLENYINFLNEDGFIIFHDTLFCDGVVKLINEIQNFGLKECFSSKIKLGISICNKL